MENTKLKRILVSSLLSGSIILSVGTVAANSSSFRNATFCAQYNVKLVKNNSRLAQKLVLKPRGYKHGEKFSKALDTLIERNIITEEKAEEIKSYLTKHKEERKEVHDKIKGMTDEERKEFFKNNKKERKGIIEKMTEDGVITKEQAAELKKALKECKTKSN